MIGWALGLTCERAWVLRYTLLVHSAFEHVKMAYFYTGFRAFGVLGGWSSFTPLQLLGFNQTGFRLVQNHMGSGTQKHLWSPKPLKIAENGV